MVKEPHGGLCYDLNGLLYFILKDAGFDVKLIRGTVWKNGWARPAHMRPYFFPPGNEYIADAGFGLNLAMRPVPMSGDETVSAAGAFRVRIEETEFGTYLLEMNKGTAGRQVTHFRLKKSMKRTSSL